MPRTTSTFTHFLDLGALGEADVEVKYSAYRPRRLTEDDYPEMELLSAVVRIGGLNIDILDDLSKSSLESLEEAAWEDEAD